MRIKYIYQLLASHLSILLVAFSILSILFAHYVENLVYQNKAEELSAYGNSILSDLQKNPNRQGVIADQYSQVLIGRKIQYLVFDENFNINYPLQARMLMPRFETEELTKLTQGQTIVVRRDFERFSQAVSFVAVPYIHNDQFLGGVLLTSPIGGSREMISQINKYLFITVLIALSIAVLLSLILSRIHVKRIQKIRDATSLISAGNYQVYVPSSSFDEIGELANDFNSMVDKLSKSQLEIESLENRRRQFFADVSHELRTPLTTISGMVEGIRDDMIPENEKQRAVHLINQETKRLIRLVNENLDYEKIRSNQVFLQKEVIELSEALEIIQEQLSIQAEEKNNELIVEVPEQLSIYADYDRLIQILINITKNSIQFTSEGKIWLRGKAGYRETIIEIEDTGIGIDANEIESIWHRFYKADISRTNNPYGQSGLGLSIVKKLVELHDGEIKVTSEKNKGTKFVIRIPEKQ
ncbi:sensor histidine kinase [Bacillus sp. PS06]|uniref:sensor histidine kinase n=1 Tax=Bacillus sp. PS06 TaxID=2764176 RepID=UPI001784982E|nr:HAMP domain-containing sensor histidine kinase [Bacillus sp. PS06]MBD8067703.1 HAMP domain-containing histidine kinase [Bacillus sp. PS06]